jgi:ArsR family transcriptional regulator, arsenate/arsenite/antimonite-responsive transcriptional repressor
VRVAEDGSAVGCCAPLAAPSMSVEEAEATAGVFAALADRNRVRIVNLLAATDRPLCVCEFVEPLGVSQPTVSHHLKKLTDAGLLERDRRGTWVYYSLDRDAARRLAAVVDLEGVLS